MKWPKLNFHWGRPSPPQSTQADKPSDQDIQDIEKIKEFLRQEKIRGYPEYHKRMITLHLCPEMDQQAHRNLDDFLFTDMFHRRDDIIVQYDLRPLPK